MEIAIWTLTTLKPAGPSTEVFINERPAELARIKETVATVGERMTAIALLEAGNRAAYDEFMREHADPKAKLEYRALQVPTPAEQMCDEHDTTEGWGEHPQYSMEDWRDEVANQDTRLGYWDWCLNQIEMSEEDDEDQEEGD